MEQQPDTMTIWGIGQTMLAAGLAYALPAAGLSLIYPQRFAPKVLPLPLSLGIGVVLLLMGIGMVVAAVRTVVSAFREGELITTGIYGLVRNPIYAAWIFFLIPALTFLVQGWLLLGTSVVVYVAFKLSIRKERDYLRNAFGPAYEEYEQRVNEIFPWPRRP